MGGNVLQVRALIGSASAEVSAARGQRGAAVGRDPQSRVARHHELHGFFGNRALCHFIQRLQHFKCLSSARLGAVNLELLKAVRDFHV